MKILAIDPGYERCGVAVLEKTAGKESLAYSDCIQTSAAAAFHDRLGMLGQALEKLFEEHCPDALGIETLLFTNNQKTAMKVSEVRGMVIYLAVSRGIPVYEYTPTQIKVAITGYGASDKKHVISMVEKLVVLPLKKRHDDEYDAIAVGLTCLASQNYHSRMRI